MRKILKKLVTVGMAGVMCVTNVQVYANENDKDINRFMDCFKPMPITGSLTADCWGAPSVGPRDQDNGLEDRTMSDYCYWDGTIIKDDDSGKYYMYASRWPQNGGHWGSKYDGNLGWRGSQAIRAVSDNLYGPYHDEGPLWEDYYNGAGHNVFAFKLSEKDHLYGDYKYAVVVSDVGRNGEYVNGTIHLTDKPTGEFEHIGKMNVDTNLFSLSNISIVVRPDGRYEAINRHGDIAIADSIEGPWEVVNQKLWWKVPGMPKTTLINVEDPVIWYSDGLYHLVANKWDTRYAYYFTSKDGIANWKLQPGTAYNAQERFLKYTDGTYNMWTKLERPGVYIEEGTLKAMTFAVIDVQKEEDMPNDMHGSKVIVVPFDGQKLCEFTSYKDELDDREGICPVADSGVKEEKHDKNYGAEPFIEIQNQSKLGYLKYDIESLGIPDNTDDITEAYLSLVYMGNENYSTGEDTIKVSLADSNWNEGNGWSETNDNNVSGNVIKWENRPDSINIGDEQDSYAESQEFLPGDTDMMMSIDVTQLLKQYIKFYPNERNISFVLDGTEEDSTTRIGSREAGERYAARLVVHKKNVSVKDVEENNTVSDVAVNTSTNTAKIYEATDTTVAVESVNNNKLKKKVFTKGLFKYKINKKGQATITGLAKKSKKNIEIPETVTYKGIKYKVTAIIKDTFAGNKKINNIKCKKNIFAICEKAFTHLNKKCTIKIIGKMKDKKYKLIKKKYAGLGIRIIRSV